MLARSIVLFLAFCLVSCATASKTKDLQPGMSTEQVKATLGEPKSTEFISGKLVWKYSFYQVAKPPLPYYLVFDPGTQQLLAWFMNEREYAGALDHYNRQQALWLQAFPPVQRHQIDLNVR